MSSSTAVQPLSPVRPPVLGAAGLAAAILNVGAYFVGDSADATWDVGQPYAITVGAVLATTLVVFVVGGLVTWFATRRRPGLLRVAAWGGLAFGLLSMLSLLNAADVATGLALGSMHLITSVAWVVGLLARAPKEIRS